MIFTLLLNWEPTQTKFSTFFCANVWVGEKVENNYSLFSRPAFGNKSGHMVFLLILYERKSVSIVLLQQKKKQCITQIHITFVYKKKSWEHFSQFYYVLILIRYLHSMFLSFLFSFFCCCSCFLFWQTNSLWFVIVFMVRCHYHKMRRIQKLTHTHTQIFVTTDVYSDYARVKGIQKRGFRSHLFSVTDHHKISQYFIIFYEQQNSPTHKIVHLFIT